MAFSPEISVGFTGLLLLDVILSNPTEMSDFSKEIMTRCRLMILGLLYIHQPHIFNFQYPKMHTGKILLTNIDFDKKKIYQSS